MSESALPFPPFTIEQWADATETLVIFDMFGAEGFTNEGKPNP